MKIGMPGFNGSRLKEAREARGRTATSLADQLDIAKQAISQYESGTSSPRPELLDRIATALEMPTRFFLQPNRETKSGPIFYRSLSSATLRQRRRAERRQVWLKNDICGYTRQFVDFPSANIPKFDDDWKVLASNHIESRAEACRRHWGLGDGPIPNLIVLLQNNGAVVSRGSLMAATLDGYSEWCPVDRTPYIFLGADKASAVRSRLDAAHELAHLCLHHGVKENELMTSTEFKLLEQQAFAFAAAFLLPARSFAYDFFAPNLDSFLALKPKWKVSVAAMIRRCSDIGILSEDATRRMWIEYSRRGWRTHEPLDDTMAPEQPKLLARAFEAILTNGIQTREDVAANIPLAKNDIEDLANLEPGYLSTKADMTGAEPQLRSEFKNYNNGVSTKAQILRMSSAKDSDGGG